MRVVSGIYRYVWCAVLIASLAGCSRAHYRLRADGETYATLDQKAGGTPWSVLPGFSVVPDSRSRFYDPTPLDDPLLPVPAPQLYAYSLGELPQRDPARFRPGQAAGGQMGEEVAPGPVLSPEGISATASDSNSIRLASFQAEADPPDALSSGEELAFQSPSVQTNGELRIVPVPPSFWEAIPTTCLVRMLEFPYVRTEYRRTFGAEPPSRLRDPSPRLALEDIVQLAQINSREYQRQKEILYSAALQLTLERFAYDVKFAASGNTLDVDLDHNRVGGITDNTLSVPSRLTSDKLLVTGGDLLARFANDVVLTFNGVDGFAADVGSELLFDVSQSVFQRDIVFESLTQAERNVVYAARDFARFRKQLFRDLAFAYYGLLLSYRDIEINTQDYFGNVRGFTQGQAEYRADRLPRFQVDQFEQDALASGSRLIGQCTALENSLDSLKLLIGIPPETPINLDLTELIQLTLRDEATVNAELVGRAQRNLASELEQPEPDQLVLVSGASVLVDRLIEWIRVKEQLGEERDAELNSLQETARELTAAEARLLVEFNELALRTLSLQGVLSPPLLYQRTMDLVDSILQLAGRQLDMAKDPSLTQDLRAEQANLQKRYESIRARLEAAEGIGVLDELIRLADALRGDADALVLRADELAGYVALEPEQRRQVSISRATQLLLRSEQTLEDESGGLIPIEIGMDDAMLTGLVQRFDVMNERGALADTWRQIKLAGDDLRSILNLNASQTIRTRSDVNRVFDFTFDDSTTRLALNFDAPLNRRAQRNTFRQSLINYQVALRSLIALEDGIKASIRENLRELQLDQEQYRISVASAALASERLVSTRLELSLGRQNVAARDVLESQQAYTASLRAVAGDHIGYVLDRIELFLDLELLQVDQDGFWPQVYDENYQATANLMPPVPGPPYGQLPPRLLQSLRMRRMLSVPPGVPGVVSPLSRGELPAGENPDGEDELPSPSPPPVPEQELVPAEGSGAP